MRITHLPKEAVRELEQSFRKEQYGKQKIRYQALLLLAKGFRRRHVAEIVGMSADRLRQWVTMYHKHGLSGLLLKPAPGNHRLLTNQQKQIIKELLTHHHPDERGLQGTFWTIPLLAKLVEKELHLRYKDQDSYRRLFHWCGFSFHKPEKVNKRKREHMKVRCEELLKKDPKTGVTEKITWSW